MVDVTAMSSATSASGIVTNELPEIGLRCVSFPFDIFSSTHLSSNPMNPSKKYQTRVQVCDPREIFVMEGVRRKFRSQHAEYLRARMVSMGYSVEFGFISWTYNRILKQKVCISGQHRLGAICKQFKLVDDNRADCSTLTDFQRLETIEFFSADGNDIPLSDVIILASNANENSSSVAIPTVADKLGTVVNFLKLNPVLREKKVSFITNFMSRKAVLVSLTPRCLQRYVSIGLSMANNERGLNAMQYFVNSNNESSRSRAAGGMALSVIANSVFTSASDSAQLLCLICLNAHHKACYMSQSATVHERTASKFFKLVCEIADVVETIAQPRKLSIYEVFDWVAGHSGGGEMVSVAEFIAKHMSSWQEASTDDSNAWFVDTRRIIIERLVSALPLKTTTESAGGPGTKKPLPITRSENQQGMGGKRSEEANHDATGIVANNEADDAEQGIVESTLQNAAVAKNGVNPTPTRRGLVTRSKTASTRIVYDVLQSSGAATADNGNRSSTAAKAKPSPVRKRKKRSRKRKTKYEQATSAKRRQLERFDDKPGPLLNVGSRKADINSQLIDLRLDGCLYDDKPGLFPLQTDHPSIGMLGGNGYMKILHYLVRCRIYEATWDLFPKGPDSSPRERQVHELCSRKYLNRIEALKCMHENLHGFLIQVHNDLYYDGVSVFDAFGAPLTNVQFPFDGDDEDVTIDMKKAVDVFFDFYAKPSRCPDEQGCWDQKIWNPIVNAGSKEDINARAAGATRMFSPRHATNESLAQENQEAYIARLHIDMYLAIVVDVLRLRTHSYVMPGIWDHDSLGRGSIDAKAALVAALSGGRIILTAKNCLRQIPHCDYKQPERTSPDGSPHPEPSYFVMVASADGFFLHVWKGSHREINNEQSKSLSLSRQNVPEAIWVPPYHVLIGRGDVHHAGAGWEDWKQQEKSGKYNYSVRYHVYFKRENETLGNHVYNQYQNVDYRWRD